MKAARPHRPRVIPRGADPACPDSDVAACATRAGQRLQSNPDDADALFVLAASNAVCGRFAEAAALLTRLIRLRVDYPGVWLLKRTVHEALGEPLSAAACAHAAVLYADT